MSDAQVAPSNNGSYGGDHVAKRRLLQNTSRPALVATTRHIVFALILIIDNTDGYGLRVDVSGAKGRDWVIYNPADWISNSGSKHISDFACLALTSGRFSSSSDDHIQIRDTIVSLAFYWSSGNHGHRGHRGESRFYSA
ncbi:hypothetical protein LMH87_000255 [Akanthomyces muscarius]|uniref:Uncharacterized protein n=1 Tax=Akanthomyces muscarius TaxID=2231603 RepID=A0A9W8UNN0_AKAMU|nr:hypothetical protein LMH87_000255 [Akanthomyces muscarius]KAJ4154985.1 hypothetical protein LMH87_000255 [Akanthomyces muscarius]